MPTEVIRIPAERHAQLKALAKLRGQTIADCIGNLIASELDRDGLNESIGLPPFEIVALEDGTVHLGCPIGVFIWTKADAKSVADTLAEFAKPGGKTTAKLDMDAEMKFRRVGTSVEIASMTTNDAMAIAPAIANELARLLRNAAG